MLKKIVIFLVLAFIIICALIYRFFFSMNSLPKGEFLASSESPNGNVTINAYIARGNATVAESVRCEVIIHDKIINKKRNIYWQYRQSDVIINWISNSVVDINGVQLDIYKDTYDFRREN